MCISEWREQQLTSKERRRETGKLNQWTFKKKLLPTKTMCAKLGCSTYNHLIMIIDKQNKTIQVLYHTSFVVKKVYKRGN